jgi:hypothetical protein
MNMILKSTFLGTAILLLFFLTFPQVVMAEEAVPLLPMTVKGVALINGAPAPNGTVIAAYLNGQPVEKFLVDTSSGDYCFWISGTAEDEEKPVTFTVDGKNTGNSISWEAGKQVLSLELSVGTEVDPGNPIKDLTSKINSKSLTEIGKPEAFGKNSGTKVIESSVPEPDLKALKNMNANSGNKETAESPEGSSKLKSAPGFLIIYAFAGIVLLAFGFNLKRESRRKP